MDFNSIFQTWKKVLTSPNLETFEAERNKSEATLSTALVWMVLASVIAALLGLLQGLIFPAALGGLGQIARLLPSELQEVGAIAETSSTGGVGASLAIIIIGPLLFLISVGIYHVFASILGGRGQYGRYAYLTATFAAPLLIVSSILGIVPLAGSCASVFLAIYQFVLAYYATRAEYGLSQGRAITVVVAPILAVLALVVCVFAVVLGTVFSAVQQ